ncbi:hypothetical protein X731_29785 [Mesorhizobium sp. L2C054A000]|nr:hypothetical protein X731_29785 [Mesorhizobium sp. L2C054A000]
MCFERRAATVYQAVEEVSLALEDGLAAVVVGECDLDRAVVEQFGVQSPVNSSIWSHPAHVK